MTLWRVRPALLPAGVLLAIAVMMTGRVCAATPVAGRAPLAIDLRPGPLQQAIDRLAQAAGLQILYDPELVRGYSSPAVHGVMTPEQALQQLLARTDVVFQFTANDAVGLYRKYPRSIDALQPASVARVAHAVQPETVTVNADRSSQEPYRDSATPTAMKFAGPALVVPVAFQSLTRQTLSDQQAGRLEEVLENVSSIEPAPDGQSALGFNIRGFPTYQYYVDGVRVSPDLHHDGFRDLANVERIDIVKGPASTLYGRTEPGGLINIVTKQPLDTPYLSVEQRIDGDDRKRTQLDSGGPLSARGSLKYRFNAAYEAGGSFRESLSNRRLFFSPVVSWSASADAQVTGYLEYLRSADPIDDGLPIVGSSLPPVPARRRVEQGGEIRTTDVRAGIKGLHSVSDRWVLRYHLDGRWVQTPQSPQLQLADGPLDPASCTPSQCPVAQQLLAVPVSVGRTYFASVDLVGSLQGWGIHHTLLTGADYFDVQGHNEFVYNTTSIYTTDLYSPRYQPIPATFLQNPDLAFATTSLERWYGIYLQDQIALSEKFYIVVGARYDRVWESLDTAFGFPLADSGGDARHDYAFKRRIALVWHPLTALSVYTHYLENFGIATGLYGNGSGGTGTLLPPESAREWEIGLKTELLEGKASASAAWYNLTEVNIAQNNFDPLLSAQGFRTVTGAARSRGLEIDVQGEVLPNLQLLASYAYTDSRIIADPTLGVDGNGNPVTLPGNTGNRLYGVPRHGGSLWLTHRPPQGALGGLELGLGAIARSERQGDNANDYQLPRFTTWKALVAYGWRTTNAQFNLQLNVDNIFNTRYFESLSGGPSVVPGCPRRWLMSVRAEL